MTCHQVLLQGNPFCFSFAFFYCYYYYYRNRKKKVLVNKNSITQKASNMASLAENIVALVMDSAGAIAFERYTDSVPRLISCRLGAKVPTVAEFLALRYDLKVVEHPDFDWLVTPSVKVRFCSVVDKSGMDKLWPMTLNELKDKLEFKYWGFPMKCQGIQKEIYAFETYLAGKTFTDVTSAYPLLGQGDFIGEGGLPSN
jgi:hypothetical protein